MSITHNNKVLFLHGGPGLHAAVERAWFCDSLPVLWWDQPAIAAGDPAPFSTLTGHAARQLQVMSDLNDGPVDLIAHSFGCNLAAALTKEHPDLIHSITLLGCMSLNPFHPFLYLGQKLLDTGYDRTGLLEAIKVAQEVQNEAQFTALIQALFPEPCLPGIYFGPRSAATKDRYQELARTAPPIDMTTFFAIWLDMINTSPLAGRNRFAGKVIALLGEHDPVLRVDESMDNWRKIFPQSQFKIVDAGHILHLELPPETWLHRA